MTEAPGFNAFAVFGDRVVTSDHGVLHGITRHTVLEMAAQTGLRVETRLRLLDEFLEADDVFLSSSGGGVIPAARVDERVFSNRAAGPFALDLRARYFDWITRSEHRTNIAY